MRLSLAYVSNVQSSTSMWNVFPDIVYAVSNTLEPDASIQAN